MHGRFQHECHAARLIASRGTKASGTPTDDQHPVLFALLNEYDHLHYVFTTSCFSSSKKPGTDDTRTALEDVYRATTQVSTELLYLVEASGAAFCASSSLDVARYSRLRSDDTNLEACRHLEYIERVRRRHH